MMADRLVTVEFFVLILFVFVGVGVLYTTPEHHMDKQKTKRKAICSKRIEDAETEQYHSNF